MSNRMRTSILVDPELWKEFQIWVLRRFGGRKQSDHVEIAIQEYLEKHKEEA